MSNGKMGLDWPEWKLVKSWGTTELKSNNDYINIDLWITDRFEGRGLEYTYSIEGYSAGERIDLKDNFSATICVESSRGMSYRSRDGSVFIGDRGCFPFPFKDIKEKIKLLNVHTLTLWMEYDQSALVLFKLFEGMTIGRIDLTIRPDLAKNGSYMQKFINESARPARLDLTVRLHRDLDSLKPPFWNVWARVTQTIKRESFDFNAYEVREFILGLRNLDVLNIRFLANIISYSRHIESGDPPEHLHCSVVSDGWLKELYKKNHTHLRVGHLLETDYQKQLLFMIFREQQNMIPKIWSSFQTRVTVEILEQLLSQHATIDQGEEGEELTYKPKDGIEYIRFGMNEVDDTHCFYFICDSGYTSAVILSKLYDREEEIGRQWSEHRLVECRVESNIADKKKHWAYLRHQKERADCEP